MNIPARLAMWFASLALFVFLMPSCGGDGTEADRAGVGATCAKNEDCPKDANQCLAFKGGYCGLGGCTADGECPTGSACVAHTDGQKYCFRTCVDKVDCNRRRAPEVEANCSSSVTFVDNKKGSKVCVPPSSS